MTGKKDVDTSTCYAIHLGTAVFDETFSQGQKGSSLGEKGECDK